MSPTPAPVSLYARPLYKGSAFTRLCIAMALGDGHSSEAAAIAERRWGDGQATNILKAAGGDFLDTLLTKAEVPAGATVAGNWAASLVSADAATTEFFSLVRSRSIIGKIEGLRRIPLRTRLVSATSGFNAAWVAQGAAIPVSKAAYTPSSLGTLKLAALTVLTRELLESADPSAEPLIRNDLIASIVTALNMAFLDPGNAGIADVMPASITDGITPETSSGNGLQDIRNLIEAFPGDLERAVLIGSPETFAVMSDPLHLPTLGVRGGSVLGIPAVAAPEAGSDMILIDPDGIALGEGEMSINIATQGSIEMVDTAPAGNTITVVPPTAASTVSLWQTNSVGIAVRKEINWEVARPSVSLVSGVAES